MKKKLLVCSLLVVMLLSMASSAFALSYSGSVGSGSWYTPFTLYFSASMRGKDRNTETYHVVNGNHVTCPHYSCLVNGTTAVSGQVTVASGGTGYMYPNQGGTLRMRVKNPYSDFTIYFRGYFTNEYY